MGWLVGWLAFLGGGKGRVINVISCWFCCLFLVFVFGFWEGRVVKLDGLGVLVLFYMMFWERIGRESNVLVGDFFFFGGKGE